MFFSTVPDIGRVLLLSAAIFTCMAVRADQIRIGGTGNALGTMRILGEAFSRTTPATHVVVLPSIGSSGAIKAVAAGKIEIGVSSRPPTEEEAKGGMDAIEYGRTPTVFAVQKSNAETNITRAQIADIYRGKLAKWSDGTSIRPILRQLGDDNSIQIRTLSPEIDQAVLAAEQRTGLRQAMTDQEAADMLERIAGGIGVVALSLIVSEARELRALPLDGTEPTPANLETGRYPLGKRFYLLTAKQPNPSTRAFVNFVQSARGREILRQQGHAIP